MTSSTGRPIRVSTLGRLAITLDGEPQPSLPAQRLRCALLVYIAVVRDCTRDSLVAVFWPDRTSESARHALSQNLYELRRTLGDEWLEARGDRIEATESLGSDVAEFEAAADAGRLDAALAVYRGPFLEGAYLSPSREFEDWVERQRSRLARLHRRVRRDYLEARISAGDQAAALHVASGAVAADPFDDEMQHHLIALLAGSGDRSGALDQYERYAAALAEDGLEPLESTRVLVASIREPTSPADVRLQAATEMHAPNGAAARNGMYRRESAEATDAARSGAGAAAVATAAAPAAEEHAASATRHAAASGRRPARVYAAVAIASIAAAALLIWGFGRWGGGSESASAVSRGAEQRLAVLPFEFAGGPEAIGYLATQLPIALIHQLRTEVPTLPVVSQYGVLQYAGANVSLDSVARALGATLLVGGSIIQTGEGVTVRVQLIDGVTSDVLRSIQVRGTGSEPLALIGGVVQEVTHFLRSELGQELRVRRWRAGTTSDVAFDLFGRGEAQRQHWLAAAASQDSPAIGRGLGIADSLFAAAEVADPQWPEPALHRAHVAEHRAYYAIRRREPPLQHFEAALGHVERALRIRPDHAASLEARAGIKYRMWRTLPEEMQLQRRNLLSEAEHDVQQALTVDADRPSAWSLLSTLYSTRGEYHLAYTAAEQGYTSDYYFEGARALLELLTRAAFETGNDEAARSGCLEGQQRFLDWQLSGAPFLHCALLLGGWSSFEPLPPDSAWKLANRLVASTAPALIERERPTYHAMVAANLARNGLPDSARAVLSRAEAALDPAPRLLPTAAAVHLLLGDHDTALERLRRFTAEQPVLASQLLRSRWFESLRDDPEFRSLAGLLRD